MNDELPRMWKEAFVQNFNILPWNVRGGTEERPRDIVFRIVGVWTEVRTQYFLSIPFEIWRTNRTVVVKPLIYKTTICNRLKEVTNTPFMDEWSASRSSGINP
jgi:hypothetical protein